MNRDDIKLLLDRAAELREIAAGSAAVGDFYTPAEQRILMERFGGCFFWGGYKGAERRAAVFVPEWMADMAEGAVSVQCGYDEDTGYSDADTGGDGGSDADPHETSGLISPFGKNEYLRESIIEYIIDSSADDGAVRAGIVPVNVNCSRFANLSHRDWMGSVLALGIERRCIGDICVTSPHSAVIFAARGMGEYIAENLKRAGKDGVQAAICQWDQLSVLPRKFQHISVTAASPRLDGIVKALCSVSRGEAAQLIGEGLVEVNYFTELRCDKNVSAGDVICVRSKGKFIIDSDDGINRRGRLRLSVRKYI